MVAIFSLGDTTTSTSRDWELHLPPPARELLDKNGSYKPSTYDYTWAGVSSLSTSTVFGTSPVYSWSDKMTKKFTPKKAKRRGFRD